MPSNSVHILSVEKSNTLRKDAILGCMVSLTWKKKYNSEKFNLEQYKKENGETWLICCICTSKERRNKIIAVNRVNILQIMQIPA